MNKSIVVLKTGLTLGYLCITVVQGAAQKPQTRALTLQEAVIASLAHSNELKADGSKMEAAAAAVQEAKNSRLPEVDISGQYLRVNEPNIHLAFSPSDENTGTDGGNAASFPTVDQALIAMASASLPLFTGGKITQGIASARFLEEATRLDAEYDRSHLIQNTVAAYYNLYKAQAAVALVKENLKSSQQRVKDFMNLEANGLIARNDLLKVQLQESNLELALISAENNAAVCNYNFSLMLGMDGNTLLVLDTSDMATAAVTQPVDVWEASALDHRSDYLALASRGKAAKAGVGVAKSAYFPMLALSAGYVGANIPHALTVTNAVNAGLSLQYNLGSLYKAGASVRQAKAREEEMNWHLQQLTEQIKSEIHQAYLAYTQSLKKIDVYQKAMEQANENYRITKNKYENSLATTTDLLDADVARLQAQIDYAYARADAAVAYHQLQERSGVETDAFTAKQN